MTVIPAEGLVSGAVRANHLYHRLGWLVALLAVEWLPISARVSTGRGGQSAARALVAFLFFLFTFAYFKVRGRVAQFSQEIEGASIGWGYLGAHLGFLGAFLGLSRISTGHAGAWEPALAVAWFGTGCLAVVLAALAFVPPRHWFELLLGTGYLWALAAGAALVAWRFVVPLWAAWDNSVWEPAIGATLNLTSILLRPFLHDLVMDRAARIMGSSHFAVTIGGPCAGFEGAGLMLVFSIGWLWFFRRECRFPQALVLVPASVGVMWLLNGVRIAALILIGNAGFPRIAVGGFHSQAGWISFNVVALGVSLAATKVSWWRAGGNIAGANDKADATENPTAAYLLPFLAILAASMISRAASGGFEWLYPLRLVVAAGALWWYRSKYVSLNWRISWASPAMGVLVFGMWMALERGAHGDNEFAATLAAAPVGASAAWLICRTVAAVVTVPIAEELAFRGFLIRRLMTADFESLDARKFSYFAVLISSVAFGLLHGDRWIAGTIAGVLYAAVYLRRGSIGDAIVAHGTTNMLIAVLVLVGGKWYLW